MLRYMILSIIILWNVAVSASPQVLVTIKPIYALVSGVMGEVGTPTLLLQGGESPHSYSLKPSQVKQLHQANLVVWVGPGIEKFLEKPLSLLNSNTTVLRLFDVEGLKLLKVRNSAAWEDHSPDHASLSKESGQPEEFDQHFWLDPQNAQIVVKAVVAALSQIDPLSASRYQDNAIHLLEQLKQLDDELQTQLIPVKNKNFLVFHDAYQYFENRYELSAVGVINLHPEQNSGAKHLHELRETIKIQKVQCVFSEPQFEPTLVATVIEKTEVRQGILDPLGVNLPAGSDGYFMLLRRLAKSLRDCLLLSSEG